MNTQAHQAQQTQEGGNTKTPSKKYRPWLMTWNNYSEEELTWLTHWAQANCKEFALNREIGEKCKTPHIQGALYLKNARTFDQMTMLFPKTHLEWSKNWNTIKKYCSKTDTREAGTVPITDAIKVKDPLEGKELRPFQKAVMDILDKEPDNRTVHWFWEPEGCTGKTTLVKSICLRNPEKAVFVNGKAADMKCAIAKLVEEKKPPKIVLLGLPRTCQDHTGSLYQGLEEIKDGIFFSGKYESTMVMYDCPHVMVFANWPPNVSSLSADRWNIVEIGGKVD